MTDQYETRANEALLPLRNLLAGVLRLQIAPPVAQPPPVVTPPPALPPLEDYPVPDNTDDVLVINRPGEDVVIENIRMRATRPGQTAIAVHKAASVTLRNFDISGFREGIVPTALDGTKIGKVVLENGIVHGITPVAGKRHQGSYFWGVDEIWMFDMIFDGSAARPASEQSHNIYVGEGNGWANLHRVFTVNASSHGAQIRCNGDVLDSAAIDCPLGFTFGGGDNPVPGGVAAYMARSLVYGGGDIGAAPRGMQTWLSNIREGEIQRNVFLDGKGGDQHVMNLDAAAKNTVGVLNLKVHDNVVRGVAPWRHSDGPMDGTTVTGMEDRTDLAGLDLSPAAWAGPDWLARLRNRELSAKDYAAWARQKVGLE